MNKTLNKIIFFFLWMWIFSHSPLEASTLKELFQEATVAFSDGNYNKAIELYEQCLKIYPEFAQAYYYLALSKKSNGISPDQIKPLLLKAVELNPSYAEAYDNLAKVSYELGEFDAARDFGLKAVELKPDLVNAHLTLAWVYLLGLSNSEESIIHFEKALELKKVAYAYFGLGMAYFMDGQRIKVLEAITVLRQMDHEDLAVKLETMIRKNKYLPPSNLGPLIKRRSQINKDFFHDEETFLNDLEGTDLTDHLKVHLRDESIDEKKFYPYEKPVTGAQRIEKLQKRGRSIEE